MENDRRMSKDGHNVIDATRTKIDRIRKREGGGMRNKTGDRDTKKSFRVRVTASFLPFSRCNHDYDDTARRRIKKEGGTRSAKMQFRGRDLMSHLGKHLSAVAPIALTEE